MAEELEEGRERPLRSGEVAQRAGVNVESLRFYEREGLLPEPPRRESGYREYPAETVGLIRFIKRAQELGFSLGEVQELLAGRNTPRAKSAAVRRMLAAKVVEIDGKIHHLQAMRQVLDGMLGACDGRRARFVSAHPVAERKRLRLGTGFFRPNCFSHSLVCASCRTPWGLPPDRGPTRRVSRAGRARGLLPTKLTRLTV